MKVTANMEIDDQELLQRLFMAVGEWEDSPYYLASDELFDLERFLTDHHALKLKEELESLYGKPLNHRFWSSFLGYHKLKRAREEIKEQEAQQGEKRQQYLQAVQQVRRSRQKWVKEWFHHHRRQQIKIIPGGKKD